VSHKILLVPKISAGVWAFLDHQGRSLYKTRVRAILADFFQLPQDYWAEWLTMAEPCYNNKVPLEMGSGFHLLSYLINVFCRRGYCRMSPIVLSLKLVARFKESSLCTSKDGWKNVAHTNVDISALCMKGQLTIQLFFPA
jgi:hypothetical protein